MFETKLPTMFAQNAGAGERNGLMAARVVRAELECGRLCHILRVASRDNALLATKHKCDCYAQLRRVVHLVAGAPVMILSNLRTEAGLVNGARGHLIGVVLKDTEPDRDLEGAVSATSVQYVVLEVPSYVGPVIFPDHPKWVPVEPTSFPHKGVPGWNRVQLPLALAWGLSLIHI